MPQLDPAPWFLILIASWLTFLMLIPPKVLAHPTCNNPDTLNLDGKETSPWNWPWQ
uniref:ATP synthase complex subunit 8 n=1 Tax=Callopanchax monroviae TaxID=748222 RepID=A0A518QNS8_9TELE|nr:ATP synthase F0 subunit 8 [Callopanchax monroviae]